MIVGEECVMGLLSDYCFFTQIFALKSIFGGFFLWYGFLHGNRLEIVLRERENEHSFFFNTLRGRFWRKESRFV